MDDLEDMDKFLEKYNLPKQNQKEIENLNRPMTSMDIETVIRNVTINKIPEPDSFAGEFYQKFREELTPIDSVDHNKLWKILKEMGIPDHLTCLLRNLYAGQEAPVRTGHRTTDWFQIGKGVCQGCILSPCLFNLYAEYIMRNAGLDEVQAGIKIAGRNINNLRYAYDTILMAESEEELKSLLVRVKEERKNASLQFNIEKTKIMASTP